MYMEIHVHSMLALRKQKADKFKVTHPTITQTDKTYMYIHVHTVYTCSKGHLDAQP